MKRSHDAAHQPNPMGLRQSFALVGTDVSNSLLERRQAVSDERKQTCQAVSLGDYVHTITVNNSWIGLGWYIVSGRVVSICDNDVLIDTGFLFHNYIRVRKHVIFSSYDEILETAVKARSELSQLEPENEKAN